MKEQQQVTQKWNKIKSDSFFCLSPKLSVSFSNIEAVFSQKGSYENGGFERWGMVQNCHRHCHAKTVPFLEPVYKMKDATASSEEVCSRNEIQRKTGCKTVLWEQGFHKAVACNFCSTLWGNIHTMSSIICHCQNKGEHQPTPSLSSGKSWGVTWVAMLHHLLLIVWFPLLQASICHKCKPQMNDHGASHSKRQQKRRQMTNDANLSQERALYL